eukprot:352834-Chlamydomonas_euryale.AAC.8
MRVQLSVPVGWKSRYLQSKAGGVKGVGQGQAVRCRFANCEPGDSRALHLLSLSLCFSVPPPAALTACSAGRYRIDGPAGGGPVLVPSLVQVRRLFGTARPFFRAGHQPQPCVGGVEISATAAERSACTNGRGACSTNICSPDLHVGGGVGFD